MPNNAPQAATNFSGKRVLIVEDDREMLSLIESVVRSTGVTEIDRAGNGERAWAHIREGRLYDLVMCDWVMPVVDGIMFLKRFRQKDKNAKILMITSQNTVADFEKAKGVGIDGYVLKPFTVAQLSSKIRTVLR